MQQEVKEEDGFETRSILCMPIVNGQKNVIGVAQLINKVRAPLPFTWRKIARPPWRRQFASCT
jgi:GAF domain